MPRIYWLLILLHLNVLLFGQINSFPNQIDSADFQNLKTNTQKKEIPSSISLQTQIALSRYPELNNVNISFRFKKIRTSMACRPSPLSVFRKRTKRKYTIFINNKQHKKEAICIKNLSFNAQVGVIAHELGHVVDYQQKTGLEIIGVAIRYNFKKQRSKFEKSIDSIAITRGFGWQIYEFSKYIQSSKNIPEKYKTYKRKIYYTPADIVQIINKLTLSDWLQLNLFLFLQ